ncbi:MAG: hypothetical protein JXB42_11660, partial [Deltaproteobacteria bacterium]|nr:hypothetical protein [Deltaproteobacteria bacterium]
PSRYRSYVINIALRKFFQTDFSHDLLNVVLGKGKKKYSKTLGGPHRKSSKDKSISLQTKVSTGEAALEKKSDIEKYLGLDAFQE